MFARFANVSNWDEPGQRRGESRRHRGEPGRHRGKPELTVAKYLKPVWPGGAPVHRLGYPCFAPDHPGLSRSGAGDTLNVSRFVTVSPRFYLVFDIFHGSPRFAPVVF